MSYAAYVIAGYLVTAVVLATYAAWVVSRGRRARRLLGDRPRP